MTDPWLFRFVTRQSSPAILAAFYWATLAGLAPSPQRAALLASVEARLAQVERGR